MPYDVALSYASPDRSFAQQLADELRGSGFSVFVDRDEQAKLAGNDLIDRLAAIYGEATLCVPLVSASYVANEWTDVERRFMQERDRKEPGCVVPVLLDETPLPGLLSTVAALTGGAHAVAETIARKLGTTSVAVEPQPSLWIDDVHVEALAGSLRIDVRLRNAGSSVIHVTRADLHVLKSEETMTFVPSSATYPLTLNGDHNEREVSHELAPGKVDRFLLEVGLRSACRGRAEIILRYNRDQTACSAPFDFSSPTGRTP